MTDPESQSQSLASQAPRSYIWWAIAATAFCFAPFGIVAIWFGYRTLRAIEHDQPEKAQRSSRQARRWLIITAVFGFLVNLALLVIFGLMGAFST